VIHAAGAGGQHGPSRSERRGGRGGGGGGITLLVEDVQSEGEHMELHADMVVNSAGA